MARKKSDMEKLQAVKDLRAEAEEREAKADEAQVTNYDPELEQRQREAALTESATMNALRMRQLVGCTMPDKLLTSDTVGSVPPGTTGYIDPYYVGVDDKKRVWLYGRAPLSREPAKSGPALIKVMRTHMGWTVYALGFMHYRWTPNAVMWPFATDADLIPVFQLQA